MTAFPVATLRSHTAGKIGMTHIRSHRQATARAPLKIGGLVPFTATDYPGHLAAVIFVQGCPWRCGYCHNPHLQERTPHSPLDWQTILDFLRRRDGMLDSVVFSGGEPTMDPALEAAIHAVRELGFKIGLHTGGTHPRRLRDILPWVDWVGLDIKADFQNYDKITRVHNSGNAAKDSLQALLDAGVSLECRSTIHPQLHSPRDILRLGHYLHRQGVRQYALQVFRTQGCRDSVLNQSGQALHAYPGEHVTQALAELFPRFELRRD